MNPTFRVFTLLVALALPGCAWHKEGKHKPDALFGVGSTVKQVTRSMGAPGQITLRGDTEYWHYGSSWVAFLNERVVKYENQGSLRVVDFDSQGNPVAPDAPVILPPLVSAAAQTDKPFGQPQRLMQTKIRSKISDIEDAVRRRPASGAGSDLTPQNTTAPFSGTGDEVPVRGQWVK